MLINICVHILRKMKTLILKYESSAILRITISMALEFPQVKIENSMYPILHHFLGIVSRELMLCLGFQAIFILIATCLGVSFRL